MNKPIHRTNRIPENIQNLISEISNLLGYSHNQVVVELLDMGTKMIFSPDFGGLPKIIKIARTALLEDKMWKTSTTKASQENSPAILTLETLPAPLKARLLRLALNGRQMSAIRHLISSHHITRREYEILTLTPSSTAKRQLASLVKSGVLVKKGKSRGSWYELINEAKTQAKQK